MKLYLSVIGVAMAVISAFNIILNTAKWYYIIIAVVLSTALQFALDGLIAIIINKLPNKYFGIDNRFYDVTEKEKRLYKRLKVKDWKDKVWELGGLGGFSKSHIVNPDSPQYFERFVIECNKGVLTHRLSYPIGFLVMLLFPNICAYTVAVPVATVNLFLNILPTIVLRYNTPKLKAVLKRMERKTVKK
jgi:hypothetical protein